MRCKTQLSFLVAFVGLVFIANTAIGSTTWSFADEFTLAGNAAGPGLWVSGSTDGTTFTPYASTLQVYGAIDIWWPGDPAWQTQGLISKNVTASPYEETDNVYWEPGQAVLRAGTASGGMKSVVRWTAPADGDYYIYGHFTNQNFFDLGTMQTIQVQAGGGTVFEEGQLHGFYGRAINDYSDRTPDSNPDATYYSQSPITLAAGQNVDLILSGNDEYSQHNFGIDLRISTDPITIPEPSAIIMLLMSVFSLLAYAWRKRR